MLVGQWFPPVPKAKCLQPELLNVASWVMGLGEEEGVSNKKLIEEIF